jgi:hypothetical protein
MDDDDGHGFGLFRGGLWRRFGRATRMLRDDRRDVVRQSVAIAIVAWVPVVGLWMVEWVLLGRGHVLFSAVEIHVRWLVAVPLLFVAERLVDERIGMMGRYLRESGVVTAGQRPALHRIERRVEAVCDSAAFEVALLVLAVAVSAGDVQRGDPLSRWWDCIVSLPLYRFLLLRWLQRWLLWAVLLIGVARLDLDLNGLHPDRAGGLGILVEPTRAFSLVIFAIGIVIASVLGTRMQAGAVFGDFVPVIATYVGLGVGIAMLPLLTFAPMLVRTKRATLYRYGAFAHGYVHAFADRWFHRNPSEALGSGDIQSLNDLGGSHNVVREMRVLPFTTRSVTELMVIALLPMFPLYLKSVSIATLAAYLLKALF